jgi:regulator of nucleoside diphosphate kinase
MPHELRRFVDSKPSATMETAMPSYRHPDLPPITLTTADSERLSRLADAAAETFPRTADFLGREINRAQIVDRTEALPGLVKMDSEVEFRDDVTGQVRTIRLVYPQDADMSAGRISVLTPVGAALIGLSAGQSIEWQAPSGGWRSLTVLSVRPG